MNSHGKLTFPDHSIHTTRLWALNETKRLANNWNVDNFFMITHCDIVNCLLQLKYMKMSDYSPDIEKGGLNPHVQVCSNMRAKLVSEIMANYQLLQVRTQRYDKIQLLMFL